ncbi:MAG: thiamine phosphate synthase [Verrucomicrobiota bacterium]|nr:thiamine phosphate synthase [Verrucomicrobiota bacterium]
MSVRHDERMRRFVQAGLYVVTSREFSAGRSTPAIVKAALDAGVSLIQLREKSLSKRELLAFGREVRALTAAVGAILIVNDYVDVAMALDADGVHLGQEDFSIAEARRIAPDLIVGASTRSAAQAEEAQCAGASYVNIGPLFPTSTKEKAAAWLGLDGLRAIAGRLTIPFTVMGGIKAHHIPDLLAAGARTVAVVSAVTAAADPAAAARGLLAAIRGAEKSSSS